MGRYDTGSDYLPRRNRTCRRASRNSVRIIGGGWRGRRVSFPGCSRACGPRPIGCARPCSIGCSTDVAGARCLDLFAGSGALGLEALSRGAKEVVFVEQARRRRAPCRSSCSRLGGAAQGAGDGNGRRALLRSSPRRPFDIVFLDPPFGRGALAEYVPAAGRRRLARAGGAGVPGKRTKAGRAGAARRIGNCSNRSRRARWGIIWRASTREFEQNE